MNSSSIPDREFFNNKILEEISTYLKKHKELRFIQALWALGIISRDKDGNIVDRFYEEPNITLESMVPTIREERKK